MPDCIEVSLMTWPSTTAARSGPSGPPQPASTSAAPTASAATERRTERVTSSPFDRSGPLRAGGGHPGGLPHIVHDDRADDVTSPGEHVAVAQRAPPDPGRHRLRDEHGAQRVLDDRARVEPLQSQLLALAQLERAEPHVVALQADVADAGSPRDGAQPGDLEQ